MLAKFVLILLSLLLLFSGVTDLFFNWLTRITYDNGALTYSFKLLFDFICIFLGSYALNKTLFINAETASKRILVILPILGGVIWGYYYMFYSPFNEEKKRIEIAYTHLRVMTEHENEFFNKYKNFSEKEKLGKVQYYDEMRKYKHKINDIRLELDDAGRNAYRDLSFESYAEIYCIVLWSSETTKALDSYVFGVPGAKEPILKSEKELDRKQFQFLELIRSNIIPSHLPFTKIKNSNMSKKIKCNEDYKTDYKK